jgi:hypothetical protein
MAEVLFLGEPIEKIFYQFKNIRIREKGYLLKLELSPVLWKTLDDELIYYIDNVSNHNSL